MNLIRTKSLLSRPRSWVWSATAGWVALFVVSLVVFGFVVRAKTEGLASRFVESFVAFGLLPRAGFALLGGAALGLSGALLQRVLRNPAADPSTLGVSSGAQLALGAATLFAPALMGEARSAIAFAGGATALALVLVLSRARNYDPVTMILCGLVVSLVCGALSATLILAGGDYMLSLYLWGGGALAQSGWRNDGIIAALLFVAAMMTFLLRRPLTLLGLSDESAKGLGVSTSSIRLSGVLAATLLATTVTAFVGIIGFVGLMAANLARLSGARTANAQLLAAPFIGAVLLFATDTSVLAFETIGGSSVATGAVTALVGGPLLLWLLPRLPQRSSGTIVAPSRRLMHTRTTLVILVIFCLLAGGVSLFLAPDGWGLLAQRSALDAVFPLRWPRLLAGASAGTILATAGVILQRITGNPIASPEILGISSGAGLGLAVLLLWAPLAGISEMLVATALGSLAALASILIFARAARLGPERLLLGGIAVASIAGSGVTLVMARGGPEASRLLDWMSGSTLRVTPALALSEVGVALLLVPMAILAHRWLTVLPLGASMARALGVPLGSAGGLLVTLAAILTAAATLVVGPLSFVGLIAPHLARAAGFHRAREQLLAAGLIGALLMIATDTAARSLAFPYQLPTGLFAALVGGPYLVVMLIRKPH